MKYLSLIFAFLSITCFTYGQNANKEVYKGYVKYIGSSAPGTITVECSGFAKKKKAVGERDAMSEAFYTLLFRGIPGSQYELPMISDENGKKNDPTVVALLDGKYMTFVTSSTEIGEDKKVKKVDGAKGTMSTYTITINCDALRRYLEQNNVIPKFGL